MNERSTLAELLVETGRHHHAAYQSSDGVDPEWAIWYAGYLQARLWDTFGDVPTRSRLVQLLLTAEDTFNSEVDDEEWNAFYADVIVTALDRPTEPT